MGGKKKNSDDITVEFIGNSAVDVTQSCVKITFLDKVYLLECGSVQGYTLEKCYTLNSQLVNSIDVENIEAIFGLHVHQDHIGNIPALIKKKGFNAKIITTYETSELAKLMWLDAAYIIGKEAEALAKNKKNKVSPLYKDTDVYRTFDYLTPYSIGEIHKINENVSFKLLNNSHCLGACQLELYFRKFNNTVKKITYTSDIGGGIKHKPFVKEMEYSTKNNLFIMEGTYGKKERSFTKQDIKNEKEDMKKTIKEVIKNHGRVLLPTFSFSRTQEILKDLYDMFYEDEEFGDTPVIIDSKLSVDVTATYKKILQGEDLDIIKKITSWENVKMNKDIKGTMANLAEGKPCVVCSSQGFMEAGRSQLYGKEFLPNEKDAILFVGFCPENSVGGRIMNEETKSVKIGDRSYPKMCLRKSYKTYSSHAQSRDLLNYIKMVNTDKIIIHHSSPDAKQELIKDAIDELRSINKTTPIMGSIKNLILKL